MTLQRGDWVRFAFLPQESQARPKLVSEVFSSGAVRLAGHSGSYSAFMLVKVDPPKKTEMVQRVKSKGIA